MISEDIKNILSQHFNVYAKCAKEDTSLTFDLAEIKEENFKVLSDVKEENTRLVIIKFTGSNTTRIITMSYTKENSWIIDNYVCEFKHKCMPVIEDGEVTYHNWTSKGQKETE